jgi:cobalt/nickel transport system permease protein
MMFNLPLPGGTTGHALGVGVAAIVLGPWGSIVALSTALAIQAVFFADGGITALGANCFNMAIVGSLTAWIIYKVISGRVPLDSSRRVVAAGIAGYVAINVSALLAAIEFGIQPGLFHDAAGSPLYAPYPLHIAIPAMMIGHLTIAGLAEMIVTGGVVAWLQRSEPQLLRATAPGAQVEHARSTRPLWAAVASLMILTPLGILAAGTAWGEWSPSSFVNPPAGLQKLSSLWSAPMPGYALPFFHSTQLSYLLSAMTGIGLIILFTLGFSRLTRRS